MTDQHADTHALTLRLSEEDYESLRRQAYVQRRTITAIVREAVRERTGTRGPDDPLTVRANPETPRPADLAEIERLGGLEAVWRNGCDAGMVAP